MQTKQHAHEVLEQLGPGQLDAVVGLLEVLIKDEDDQLSEEDGTAIASSREYFAQNPSGVISFEQTCRNAV